MPDVRKAKNQNHRIMNNFYDQEKLCAIVFAESGTCWHLCTPEDYKIIFTCDEEFKVGMDIIGICARLFPQVRMFTFELMSNHLHMFLAGREEDIRSLFALIKKLFGRQLAVWGRPDSLSGFDCKLRVVETLDDGRNVLAYDNRNGFLVNPATSPFSYPWGANRYYYNVDAKERYRLIRRKMPVWRIRQSVRGGFADKIEPLHMLDGYACPMDFCDIEGGERLFRNARHYFFSVSRNIESQKKIAAEVGERIFYTDDELFAAVSTYCKNRYDCGAPTQLPAQAKQEVAQMMHFDYNAGNIQIQRILRLDAQIVNALFPLRAPDR